MKNRTLYILVGPPGSGKGTVSQMCAQNFGWEQFSTGNLFRKLIKEQTEVGREIDFTIKSGKLVSDNLITQIVLDWFEQHLWHNSVVILDGYPRTVKQVQEFDKFMSLQSSPFEIKVINFIIDDAKIIERIKHRFVCENKDCQASYAVFSGSSLAPKISGICDHCGYRIGQRKDDAIEIIKERLKVYHLHEKEVIDFFKKNNYTMLTLCADRPVKDVFEEFRNKIGVSKSDHD